MYIHHCVQSYLYTRRTYTLTTNGETRVVPILHLYPSDTGFAVLYYTGCLGKITVILLYEARFDFYVYNF